MKIKKVKEQNQQNPPKEQKLEEQTVSASFLSSLVTEDVNVNLNGPDNFEGKLLGSGKEHIAVQTSDGSIAYYQLRHIKAVSKKKANNSNSFNLDENFEVVNVQSFADVLKAHKKKWVKVNSTKKDSLEGFLSEVDDDHIVLINDGEVSYISIYHIKNISEYVETEESQEENQSQEKNQSQENKQNTNQQQNEERDTNRRVDFLFDNRRLFRI